MRKLLETLICVMTALTCCGQSFTFNDLAFQTKPVETTWTPASLVTLGSWWIADNVIVDANNIATNLPDSHSTFPLTNSSAMVAITVSNNWLKGHTILKFAHNTNSLCSGSFTVNQPDEYTLVVGNLIWDSYDGIVGYESGAGYKHALTMETTTSLTMNAGSSVTGTIPGMSTGWTILTLVWNGASSEMYTNNVLCKSGNAGTYNMINGIRLGRLNTGSSATVSGVFLFAEMLTFTTTNTAANRTLVYNYLDSKYR